MYLLAETHNNIFIDSILPCVVTFPMMPTTIWHRHTNARPCETGMRTMFSQCRHAPCMLPCVELLLPLSAWPDSRLHLQARNLPSAYSRYEVHSHSRFEVHSLMACVGHKDYKCSNNNNNNKYNPKQACVRTPPCAHLDCQSRVYHTTHFSNVRGGSLT
jgi:hypothetical protein